MAARVSAFEFNPEPAGKARLSELEERRAVGLPLTAAEEDEVADLREAHAEFAAVMDLMDLEYFYHSGDASSK